MGVSSTAASQQPLILAICLDFDNVSVKMLSVGAREMAQLGDPGLISRTHRVASVPWDLMPFSVPSGHKEHL